MGVIPSDRFFQPGQAIDAGWHRVPPLRISMTSFVKHRSLPLGILEAGWFLEEG